MNNIICVIFVLTTIYALPKQCRNSSVPPEWFRYVFLNEILKVIRAEYNI